MILKIPSDLSLVSNVFKNVFNDSSSSLTSILNAWNVCFAGWPFLANTLAGRDFYIISTSSNVVSIGFSCLALQILSAILYANASSP